MQAQGGCWLEGRSVHAANDGCNPYLSALLRDSIAGEGKRARACRHINQSRSVFCRSAGFSATLKAVHRLLSTIDRHPVILRMSADEVDRPAHFRSSAQLGELRTAWSALG